MIAVFSGAFPQQIRRVILLLFVAIFGVLYSGFTSVIYAETPQFTQASNPLPFDMPSTNTLRSSKKLVMAHYFLPHTISLDNKDPSSDYYVNHYLPPGDSQFSKHGGLTRERPLPRAPITTKATNTDPKACPLPNTPEYRLQDMRTDVRNAINAGIDGFTMDILQLPGDPDFRLCQSAFILLQAAQLEDPNFKIMLMPDMSGGISTVDMTVLVDFVAKLAQSPSAYRLPDGRLVISPFQPEHGHDAAWWKSFMSTMESRHGIKVAFVPCFVFTPTGTELEAYASISYGLSQWGSRNPTFNSEVNLRNVANVAHSRNLLWMQPVSLQDERPRSAIYDEANNTENLRATWNGAIANNAEWVQLTTWNDYSESSEFAPSTHTGWSPLDISAYYLTRYKTGAWPTIKRDTIYVSHRVQPAAAQPTGGQTVLMQLRRGSSPARDKVEVLSFLTAASTVKATIGVSTVSASAPAGISAQLFDLKPGSVAATVERDGQTLVKVSSPYAVTTTPEYQDLHYYFVSSGREGLVYVPPAAPTYDLTVANPVSGQTVKGTTMFSGTQTGLANVEVWNGNAMVSRATISGSNWSATVDTTKQPNGNTTYVVYGWDVSAGQVASNTVSKTLNVTVDNPALPLVVKETFTGSLDKSLARNYDVSVGAPGDFVYDLSWADGQSFSVYVFDANGNRVAQTMSSSSVIHNTVTVPSAGTYTVQVRYEGWLARNYTLQLTHY